MQGTHQNQSNNPVPMRRRFSPLFEFGGKALQVVAHVVHNLTPHAVAVFWLFDMLGTGPLMSGPVVIRTSDSRAL